MARRARGGGVVKPSRRSRPERRGRHALMRGLGGGAHAQRRQSRTRCHAARERGRPHVGHGGGDVVPNRPARVSLRSTRTQRRPGRATELVGVRPGRGGTAQLSPGDATGEPVAHTTPAVDPTLPKTAWPVRAASAPRGRSIQGRSSSPPSRAAAPHNRYQRFGPRQGVGGAEAEPSLLMRRSPTGRWRRRRRGRPACACRRASGCARSGSGALPCAERTWTRDGEAHHVPPRPLDWFRRPGPC